MEGQREQFAGVVLTAGALADLHRSSSADRAIAWATGQRLKLSKTRRLLAREDQITTGEDQPSCVRANRPPAPHRPCTLPAAVVKHGGDRIPICSSVTRWLPSRTLAR